jgi:transcriptional regulator of heat shock response
LLQEKNLSSKCLQTLASIVAKDLNDESKIKELAKTITDISKNAVLVGFGPENVYYTGLSNLFAQPEFRDYNLVRHMSQIIDHLDEVMNGIFDEVNDLTIWVGKENPFGAGCSVVFYKYQSGDFVGIFGILGPTRMDYQKNIALVKNINNLFKES